MELNARQLKIKEAEVDVAMAYLCERMNLLRINLISLGLPANEKTKINRMREEELFLYWQNARTQLYELYLAGKFMPACVHQDDLYKLGSQELVYYNFKGLKDYVPEHLFANGKLKKGKVNGSEAKWSVFFSPKVIAPALANPHIQYQLMKCIVSYSIGYMDVSDTFKMVQTGPYPGSGFFTQLLEDEFILVFCIEFNQFINLVESIPKHYDIHQVIKVIGLVKSMFEVRKIITTYITYSKSDSDRFPAANYLNKIEGVFERRGVYSIPYPSLKVFLDRDTIADLEFNESENRWTSTSKRLLEERHLFNEDTKAQAAKKINSILLEELLNPEDCRRFIEFLMEARILKYQLSSQEIELIGKPGNLIGIGRSGTGKTTCAVLRLLALQYLFDNKMSRQPGGCFLMNIHGEIGNEASKVPLHCVFLTVSPVLIKEVGQFYQQVYQKLKQPNAERVDDTILMEEKQLEWMEETGEITEYLNTHRFPLFLSIDKFLMLVDCHLQQPFFVHQLNSRATNSVSYYDQKKYMYIYNAARKPVKAFEIDFEYFDRHFWPKHKRKTKLSSSVVWTEITSVLRGVVSTFNSVGRKHSTLTDCEKAFVQEVYKEYTRWKINISGYDFQDRVTHIIDTISNFGYYGFSIHYTIVDEVQDCPVNLLMLIIRLTEYNIAFSGDTAQTIAKGIGFRFAYLRGLISKYSGRNSVPELTHLTINFRSHRRILDLANSLVSMLKLFFPESIDKLNDETSSQEGPKPIIIDSTDFSTIGLLLLGSTNSVNRSRVNFGCSQVILVRSDEDKRNLPSALKHAVCLTILESKGLEFEDVIVYNFFAGSECTAKEWANLGKTVVDDNGSLAVPGFDSAKFPLLCSELKHLYVAVTRAKKRLIFFDENPEKRACLQNIWVANEVVDIASIVVTDEGIGVEGCEAFESSVSSPEQWKAQGEKLLKLKYYEQALKCFQFSQDERMILQATAFYLADEASKTLSNIQGIREEAKVRHTKFTKPQRRELETERTNAINMFREAADKFYSLEIYERAGQCYYSAELFDRAIDAFERNQSWRQAAEIYFKQRAYARAYEMYMEARDFEMAIECLVRLRNVDGAIFLFREVKDNISSLTGPDIISALIYRKLRSMLKEPPLVQPSDHESEFTMLREEDDEFTVLASDSESVGILDSATESAMDLESASEFSLLSKTDSVVELIEESNNDPFCAAVTRLVGEFQEELRVFIQQKEAVKAFGQMYEAIQNYDAVFDDRTDPEVIGLTLDLARLFRLHKLWDLIKNRYDIVV